MNIKLPTLDRNEITYWLGLILLFIGLAMGVSVATAFYAVGGLMILESVTTSYLATWMATRTGK